MSVLDRLWRVARAEASFIARKARDLAQRKEPEAAEGAPTAEDAAAWERESQRGTGRAEGHAQGSSTARPSRDPVLAGHYAVLKLPYGAGLDEVKSAYRKAMREYHPDRHASDPRRTKAATQVAQHITESYQALKDHLGG